MQISTGATVVNTIPRVAVWCNANEPDMAVGNVLKRAKDVKQDLASLTFANQYAIQKQPELKGQLVI